jgi:hypothetical protein
MGGIYLIIQIYFIFIASNKIVNQNQQTEQKINTIKHFFIFYLPMKMYDIQVAVHHMLLQNYQ